MRGVPYSEHAEQSVVSQMLGKPSIIGQVVGTQLLPEHFYTGSCQLLYDRITAAYYADEPLDPLTIAEPAARRLAAGWRCSEGEAVDRVKEMASGGGKAATAVEHAKLVKRNFDLRQLVALAKQITDDVAAGERDPGEIAGLVGETTMQIATSTLHTTEIVSFEELGRQFHMMQRKRMAAKAQGIEIAAKFGLPFIDDYTRGGLKPGELFIMAGEAGAGKTTVAWAATQSFAERQMMKPADARIGALVMSLEMTGEQSADRYGQSVGGVDGGRIREGSTNDEDLRKIMREWGARKDIPLHFNFASHMRASQMRALVVEAIRRHRIGLIVVDHMRYFEMDRYIRDPAEADEAKASFLRNQIAKELNVAVILLAHTTKLSQREDKRPQKDDLRGGGMVAAHADFLAFVYQPYAHAKPEDIEAGRVSRTDAEMIYRKNRWGLDGIARFYMDASRMKVGGRATKGGTPFADARAQEPNDFPPDL